jgi:hypothetical protein
MALQTSMIPAAEILVDSDQKVLVAVRQEDMVTMTSLETMTSMATLVDPSLALPIS